MAEYSDGSEVQVQRLKRLEREYIEDWDYETEYVDLPGAAAPGFLDKPKSAMRLITDDPGPVNEGQIFARQLLDFYCGRIRATVEIQLPTGVPWRRATEDGGGFHIDQEAADAAVTRLSGDIERLSLRRQALRRRSAGTWVLPRLAGAAIRTRSKSWWITAGVELQGGIIATACAAAVACGPALDAEVVRTAHERIETLHDVVSLPRLSQVDLSEAVLVRIGTW